MRELDTHLVRRRRVERWLEDAGFVGSEYLLNRRLRERSWTALDEARLAPALRRVQILLLSLSPAQLRTRYGIHKGRLEVSVWSDATLWVIILERPGTVVNAYVSDHQ